MESEKKVRVEYLDMLKCLGMFIVVSGHIHNEYGWFSLPLHSFVIPLYFMLSGMTFNRSKYPNVWTFILHRSKTLLLPYLMLSIVTWAVWAVFQFVTHGDGNIWSSLLQTFIAQGSGGFLVHNVPLWFVPCLFVIELVYYFISKMPTWLNVLTCVLCAVLGSWMITGTYSDFFVLLPWSIESAFAAVIFYCVGNLLAKYIGLRKFQEIVVSKKGWSIVIIVLLTCVLVNTAHWNGHVSFGSDMMGRSPLMCYVNAFIGIITIMLFSVLICSKEYTKKMTKSIMDFHLWFGRNSFYIMATHVPVKNVLIFGIAAKLGVGIRAVRNDLFWCAVIFIITCAISCGFAVMINKMKKADEKRWLLLQQRNSIRK